jgi:predicted secreted protein
MLPKDQELKYSDKRSRKIVYISRCIMNCNAKFPGCSDVPGVYTEIIHPIAQRGVGIEQMPCLEIMGWGGVNRDKVIHGLDLNDREAPWIKDYFELCKKEAVKVVDQMEDYINSGFQILGVIYVDDSPTCGLTNTQTFPDVHFQMMKMNIPRGKEFDLDYMFENVLPYVDASGEGAYGYQLFLEVKRRKLPVKFVPFGPTKPREEEVNRILRDLNL